ncbi:uncharacterized protein LOC120283511 [Dioscorea cayenensis subsp. rotundata]|uniref:Uncharacterized protein LOC120283511 n=1 Tax=Dioscorea cayennensis subsp. rotundata TaxID=55577 RepID=A0AB40D199_DIOCR|nr:uncharacterized protein LOC120283511 [Dioscorea cayenensis subsp. rotundata]
MASVRKVSWMVAASVGAVETLKDQTGLCRWNYALRSLHHHAKYQLSSSSLTLRIPSSSSSSSSSVIDGSGSGGVVVVGNEGKALKFEKTLEKVMYLSCWGPN